MDTSKFHITTFYLFFPWKESTDFKKQAEYIENWCEVHNIKGLLLIGPEGFNGTLAGSESKSLEQLKVFMHQLVYDNTAQSLKIEFKDSLSEFMPFRRMKVKIKNEIVTLGNTNVLPRSEKDQSHLSPDEWNEFIKTKDPLVLDVRNFYEMEIGKFRTAKDWDMKEFTEFPQLVADLSKSKNIDKDEPVLMYCTGGIRCEKASIEMKNQGFSQVYQLDGGILNYLSKHPDDEFTGDCFVFDHRVAVDQKLNPSKNYVLCQHCGQPALAKEFDCIQCGENTVVCDHCIEDNISDLSIRTCSKNCRHHYQQGHKTIKPHSDAKKKYQHSISNKETTS